jgi:hypothetical protein
MFPVASSAQTSMNYATAGFSVRSQPLVGTVSGGTTAVSPVLTAPSTLLTPALLAKMNVLQGLDITYNLSHHDGRGTLGNIASNDGSPTYPGGDPDIYPATINMNQGNPPPDSIARRSIDQVMMESSTFNAGGTAVGEYIFFNSYPSYSRSSSGSIDGVGRGPKDSLSLFNDIFNNFSPPPADAGTPRRLIVDHVHDDFQNLMNNPRISKADAQRVSDHMDRLLDLETRLQAASHVSCSITPPTTSNSSLPGWVNPVDVPSGPTVPFIGDPTSPATQAKFWQMYNDVIATALHCGALRVAVMCCEPFATHFSTYPYGYWGTPTGDWHVDVAHQTDTAPGQAMMTAAQNTFFSGVMVDLASKLDQMSDGSGTTLDRTLVTWMQEYGNQIHEFYSIPVVTFGSAGGNMNTGLYCDYRNLSKMQSPNGVGQTLAAGLTWSQLLGTFLQVVGVPHSDYAEANHNGYGLRVVDPVSEWPDATWAAAGDKLPFL